ncbi:MAG: molybdenum cofactor guanylyltransferase [Candidatus Omnitrophota bacterium]
MTAIILAGGKSSRMGRDKAFIDIGGIPLIKRQIVELKKIFNKIIIVTNTPEKYKFRGLKVIRDILPGLGPLGGIYSGLMGSGAFYNFVVACDIPILSIRLIKYMLSQRYGFDAVVPKLSKGYETLFAVYSKNCLRSIYQALKSNNLRVRQIFEEISLKEITEQQIAKFGNPKILFMNINTKAALDKAKELLK